MSTGPETRIERRSRSGARRHAITTSRIAHRPRSHKHDPRHRIDQGPLRIPPPGLLRCRRENTMEGRTKIGRTGALAVGPTDRVHVNRRAPRGPVLPATPGKRRVRHRPEAWLHPPKSSLALAPRVVDLRPRPHPIPPPESRTHEQCTSACAHGGSACACSSPLSPPGPGRAGIPPRIPPLPTTPRAPRAMRRPPRPSGGRSTSSGRP